jgi:hypothetical protein
MVSIERTNEFSSVFVVLLVMWERFPFGKLSLPQLHFGTGECGCFKSSLRCFVALVFFGRCLFVSLNTLLEVSYIG